MDLGEHTSVTAMSWWMDEGDTVICMHGALLGFVTHECLSGNYARYAFYFVCD